MACPKSGNSVRPVRQFVLADSPPAGARGRQEILIPDDIVYNDAAFAALEAAAAATSIGVSYVFHRTHHHKMERWLSIGHIAVGGFGDVRNYSLKTRHRTATTQ